MKQENLAAEKGEETIAEEMVKDEVVVAVDEVVEGGVEDITIETRIRISNKLKRKASISMLELQFTNQA